MNFAADFLNYVGLTVLTLLPIINPVGAAVLLLGIGAHLDPAARERQIRKACVYASGILIAFLLLGTLAMPSLSGPGSIATVISMSSTIRYGDQGMHIFIEHVGVIIGIGVAALACYFVLRAAEQLAHKLGSAGIGAIARIMGFLMICIGVQFVINGVRELVGS